MNLGAEISLNLNDKKVQDIVAYTLLSVNQQEKSKQSHILSKIINVSKQVILIKLIIFINMQ